MIKRNINVKVEPSPVELAQCFCDMGSDQQAQFFSMIARISDQWESPIVFQLQAVSDDDFLDKGGRSVMSMIGDYAYDTITHKTIPTDLYNQFLDLAASVRYNADEHFLRAAAESVLNEIYGEKQ